jgi:glycosyltransferase involved in cell wall biosynthesis
VSLISVVAPCFNEEENVDELYRQVSTIFERWPHHTLELLFIDNASSDRTSDRLRDIAARDPRVKVILNARNFGHIRSPMHGMLQARGDAIIPMASDLQDPPEMLVPFIEGWERGYKKVVAVKPVSRENRLVFGLRRLYYTTLQRISEIPLIENFTGFGCYDRSVIDYIAKLDDPYPYFRGLVSEIGYDTLIVEFSQPRRLRGVTKNNFYTLYDIAMLGITNHSKLPLRVATIGGFVMSGLSFLVALAYLVYKLVHWYAFEVGQAPLVIGLFFLFSVQLFFIGLLGEYVLAIHRHVLHRPLVVEKERINF